MTERRLLFPSKVSMKMCVLFGAFLSILTFSTPSFAQGFHRTDILSPELSRNDQFPIVSPTGRFLIVKSKEFADVLLMRTPDGSYGIESNLNRFGGSSDILWSVNDSGTYAYSSLRDEEAYCSVSTVTKDGHERELFRAAYGDFDGCDLSRISIANNGSLLFTLRRWMNGDGNRDSGFLEETVAMFCSAAGDCVALTEPVRSDGFYFDALFTPDSRSP